MTKTFEDTSTRSSDAHQAEGGRSWLDRRFAPWVALAVLTGAAVLLVLYETRGTIFWYDEWQWITERRDFTASTFLEPHNQHLSLVPVAVYRFMLETVGIDQYWPYRLLLVVALAASGSAIFLYARPRVGPVLALAATALILFLGPGAQNILWPFQIGWLISVAAGIGALLALDRHSRRADVGAALLLGVSLASSGWDPVRRRGRRGRRPRAPALARRTDRRSPLVLYGCGGSRTRRPGPPLTWR